MAHHPQQVGANVLGAAASLLPAVFWCIRWLHQDRSATVALACTLSALRMRCYRQATGQRSTCACLYLHRLIALGLIIRILQRARSCRHLCFGTQRAVLVCYFGTHARPVTDSILFDVCDMSTHAHAPARRYKWDVVRSAIKSAAGWQRGKVAELERGGGGGGGVMGGEGEDGGGVGGHRGAGAGLRRGFKSWFGRGKRGGAGAAGGAGGERSEEEERALAELMAAAERSRQKAAKLVLLVGEVPAVSGRRALSRAQR